MKKKGTEIMKKGFVSYEEIKKRLGLSDGSQFCGYIVHLPVTDEFLVFVDDGPDVTLRLLAKSPGYAKIYTDHRSAICEAKKCGKGAIVCLFFDDDNNFIIASCED